MLTWEQKFMAMKAICPEANLRLRKPGDWYVSLPDVSIRKGSMEEGILVTGQATPEDAVAAIYKILTDLKDPNHCVHIRSRDQSRLVQWNGFMWADFP